MWTNSTFFYVFGFQKKKKNFIDDCHITLLGFGGILASIVPLREYKFARLLKDHTDECQRQGHDWLARRQLVWNV